MKNKTTRYILIFLTLIIWGTVAFKINDYLTGDDNVVVVNNDKVITTKSNAKIDSFNIVANYRDPFLDKSIFKPINTGNPTKSEKKTIVEKVKKVEEKKATNWPNLAYLGIITNQKSKAKTGILKINGKDNLIKQGDFCMEVEIFALYTDSLLVKYLGETRSIKKTK